MNAGYWYKSTEQEHAGSVHLELFTAALQNRNAFMIPYDSSLC